MQVEKLGDGLAVRIPADVVAALGLKEGDTLDLRVTDDRTIEIVPDRKREAAIAAMRALAKTLPPDWKFDREEANAR